MQIVCPNTFPHGVNKIYSYGININVSVRLTLWNVQSAMRINEIS